MKYILENPVKGVIGSQQFLTTIHWRNGQLVTDEPVKLGGKDIGPDPYTLLLSSLIACTLATLRIYIDLKGLNITEIRVGANLFHKISSEGIITQIERRIDIPGLTDAELQQKLLHVAESCPISKILKGDIKIDTDFPISTGQEGPAII